MERPKREVLVHISAPSGALDDARHLTQAAAYFSFQPVSRIQIFPGSSAAGAHNDQRDQDSGPGHADKKLMNDEEMEEGSMEEVGLTSGDEPENVGPSISTIQGKAYFNAISSDILRSQEQSGPLSSKAPPPKDRLRSGEGLLSSGKSCLAPETPQGISTPFSPVQDVFSTPDVPAARRSVDADSLEFPPSTVQDSWPTTLLASERVENHGRPYETGLSQSSDLGGFGTNNSQSMDVLLYPNKRQCLDMTGSPRQSTNRTAQSLAKEEEPKPSGSQFHCESPDKNLSKHVTLSSSRQPVQSPVLPLEIHAPPPRASNAHFKSHVTPTLQMLSDRLGLSRVFNPIRKGRELRISERGYWLVEVKIVSLGDEETQKQHCNDQCAWSLPLFIRFWSFLADFIGKEGRAGWGVWCVRETENLYPGRETELDLPRVERVKVYSWGEVVPHIYLVLFLAAERRIKGTRAQWKDAKDETVMQMG